MDDGARPRGLVRRRAAAVEHAGAGYDGGAGADGDEVAQARVGCLDVGDCGVEVGRARPEAAGDHEDFNVLWGCRVCVCWEDFGELYVERRPFTSALGDFKLGTEADAPSKEGCRYSNPGMREIIRGSSLTKLEFLAFMAVETGSTVTGSIVSEMRYKFIWWFLASNPRASRGPKTSSISKARLMIMPKFLGRGFGVDVGDDGVALIVEGRGMPFGTLSV